MPRAYEIWSENRPGVWFEETRVDGASPAAAAVNGLRWIVNNEDTEVDRLRIGVVRGPRSGVRSVTIYNFRQLSLNKFAVFLAGHRQYVKPTRTNFGRTLKILTDLGNKSPTLIHTSQHRK